MDGLENRNDPCSPQSWAKQSVGCSVGTNAASSPLRSGLDVLFTTQRTQPSSPSRDLRTPTSQTHRVCAAVWDAAPKTQPQALNMFKFSCWSSGSELLVEEAQFMRYNHKLNLSSSLFFFLWILTLSFIASKFILGPDLQHVLNQYLVTTDSIPALDGIITLTW